MHMPLSEEWLKRLKLGPRVGRELITEATQAKGHSYAEILCNTLEAGASGVFCLDGRPCAAVALPPQHHNAEWLIELHTALWNQGELDFLLLLFHDRVEIHTLDAKPHACWEALNTGHEALSPTLQASLRILEQAGEIEDIITGLESGRFLENIKGGLNTEAKVDAALIRDLEGARETLLKAERDKNPDQPSKELVECVHDVLLQAMFLLYLEDRGIIEVGYIHAYGNERVGKLHELLRGYPSDFCRLLTRLDCELNGGLFKKNPLWEKHASILADFLQGERNFRTGQGRLFRLYRFEYIPVELLSEVYDRFLGSEGGKKEQGAYYTPRRLAALVVEQAWESLRKHLDAGRLPRVLDPSCGSGIFPALLFQRIAGYLTTASWDDLKLITENLYGVDINPTAVRISAFSLYLALLHRAEPKDLRTLMDKGKVLPEILGTTLLQGNFFEYSAEKQFDCIIGNPPWGGSKQNAGATGEQWVRKNKYPKPSQGERSWPFIWKSLTHLSPEGTLALLLPSTGLFLNDVTKSLTHLLDVARLEKLVDISDLRHVLFKDADFPACILTATRAKKNEPHTFVYVCPKADLNATRGDRITLAPGDKHLIHSHAFASDSVSTTQRLMWFSPKERHLLSYLDTLPTLQDLPLLETDEARKRFPDGIRPEWGMGLGFQKDTGKEEKNKKPSIAELLRLPHADVKKDFTPWIQLVSPAWQPYGTTQVYRRRFPEGYTAPHIVMPCSLRADCRLRAGYAEENFSFNNSVTAITVPDSNAGRAAGKFLTAFLNSAFTAWFLAACGLAVNRPRFTPSLLLALPYPNPEDLPDPKRAEAIRATVIAKMDALMQQAQAKQGATLTSYDDFPTPLDVRELDNLIFAYLGLRPEEIAIIWESLELVRKGTQPTPSGNLPELWKASESKHWDTYCAALNEALGAYMAEGDRVETRPLGYSNDVVVVQVTYRQIKDANEPAHTRQQEAVRLQELPRALLRSLERPLGGNIYLQRYAMVFSKEKIFLFKPRQRRFWLTSMAHMDADHVLDNLLRAAEPVRSPA
ncbi:HsdM family class I SAM-dependent methyltransferase [Nitratidesulfovibrio termitidis]|uniref:HsdM family class I SAM-dependent methyltransferase n=1 Tax=Nitratidesulfovibrio termitidis TaxID=42252 RepID=UPI00040C0E9F|nr:N-6 DNA methylase [Nitratidesulfovibrio termitidis]